MLRTSCLKKYKEKNPYDMTEIYQQDDENYIIGNYRPLNEKELNKLDSIKLNLFVDDILNSKKVSTLIFSTNSNSEINLLKRGHEAIKKNMTTNKNSVKGDPNNIFLKRKKLESIAMIKNEVEQYKNNKLAKKEDLELKNEIYFSKHQKKKKGEKINKIYEENFIRINRFEEIYQSLKDKILRFKDYCNMEKNPSEKKIIRNNKNSIKKLAISNKTYNRDYDFNTYNKNVKTDEDIGYNFTHYTYLPTSNISTKETTEKTHEASAPKVKLSSNLNLFSLGNFNKEQKENLPSIEENPSKKTHNLSSKHLMTYPQTETDENEVLKNDLTYLEKRKNFISNQKTALPIKISLPDLSIDNYNVYSRLYNNTMYIKKKDEIEITTEDKKIYEEKHKLKCTDYHLKSILGTTTGREFTLKITDNHVENCIIRISNGPYPKIKDINNYGGFKTVKTEIKKIKETKEFTALSMIDIKTGNSYLHKATIDQVPELVQYLIMKKIDINIQNNHMETALIIAIKLKNKEIIKLLIDANADISICDEKGHNCIYYADVNFFI